MLCIFPYPSRSASTLACSISGRMTSSATGTPLNATEVRFAHNLTLRTPTARCNWPGGCPLSVLAFDAYRARLWLPQSSRTVAVDHRQQHHVTASVPKPIGASPLTATDPREFRIVGQQFAIEDAGGRKHDCVG